MLSTINEFNALALTNDVCLKTFHKTLTGKDVDNMERARETWAAYSFLNNRQIHFFLAKASHTKNDYLDQDKKNLVALLASPIIREVLSLGGYDPEFMEYCKNAIESNKNTTSHS
jgi:hypothetical protein